MPCLNVIPSAPDQLNQLAGLSEIFGSVFGAVSGVGNWVSTNQGAIVNILDATAKLKAQTAAAEVLVKNAAANVKTAQPATMTPQQWQAYQSAGVQQQALPSWVLPVGLGAVGLVLLMVMMPKRGAANG